MATVSVTYVIHNVPAGAGSASMTAETSSGGVLGSASASFTVPTPAPVPVVIDPPTVVVSSV